MSMVKMFKPLLYIFFLFCVVKACFYNIQIVKLCICKVKITMHYSEIKKGKFVANEINTATMNQSIGVI